MKNRKSIVLLFLLAACIFYAHAQEKSADTTACCNAKNCFECCRPDAFAPAGIMTDHVHPKGEFGIAYGFMFMNSQGNMSGTKLVSDDDIYNVKGYMMSPHIMNMQMHMLMPMYGITNRLTVMAMINYYVNTMSMHMMPMQNMMMSMPGMTMTDYSNMPTSSKSSGLGDTKLYLLYNLLGNCMHRLVAGAGVSLPTGNIMVKGATLQSNNDVLPYNMQLGTGTYNLLPSLIYVGQTTHLTFGAAFNCSIKPGVNSRNYSWGNEYSFSPWIAYKFHSWASISLRTEAYNMGALYGWDNQIHLSSGNDPSANYINYGTQQRFSGYAGINLYANSGVFKRMRLFIEYGMPFYQNLQGLQMPVKSSVSVRLQYNF